MQALFSSTQHYLLLTIWICYKETLPLHYTYRGWIF